MKRTILFDDIDGLKVVKGFSHKVLNNVGGRKKLSVEAGKTDEHAALEEFMAANLPFKKDVTRNERAKLLGVYKKLQNTLAVKTKKLAPAAVQYFELKNGEMEITDVLFETGKTALKDSRANRKLLIFDPDAQNEKYSEMDDKKSIAFYTKAGGVITEKRLAKLTDDYPAGAIMELAGADLALWDKQVAIKRNTDSGGVIRTGKEDLVLRESAHKKTALEIKGMTSADALAQATQEYNAEMTKIDDLYK